MAADASGTPKAIVAPMKTTPYAPRITAAAAIGWIGGSARLIVQPTRAPAAADIQSCAVYRAGSDAVDLLELLPQAVEKVRVSFVAWQRGGVNPLQHVQETAKELEKLAVAAQPPGSGAAAKPTPPPQPALDIRSIVVVGTGNAIIAAGQIISVLFLTFFVLAAGHLFRRKLRKSANHVRSTRSCGERGS